MNWGEFNYIFFHVVTNPGVVVLLILAVLFGWFIW